MSIPDLGQRSIAASAVVPHQRQRRDFDHTAIGLIGNQNIPVRVQGRVIVQIDVQIKFQSIAVEIGYRQIKDLFCPNSDCSRSWNIDRYRPRN